MAILGKSKITELEVLGNATIDGNLSAGNIEDTLTNDASKIPSSKAVYDSTIKTASATAEKIGSEEAPSVTVTTEDRNSNFHFKIPSGDDGKTLLLLADVPYFKVDNDGNPLADQTVNLTVQKSNTLGSVTWTDNQGFNVPADTLSYQLTTASITGKLPATFTITADGLTSSLTVGTLETGETPYLLDINPSTVSILADYEGTVKDGQLGVVGTAKVFLGNTNVSAQFTFSAVFGNGLTGQIDSTSGQITLESLSAEYGDITVTATKDENTFTKTLRVVKVKDGDPAGFGTPTAEATLLAPATQPTVDVSVSGEDTEKVISFEFGIPRSAPIFGMLTSESVNIACDTNGVPFIGSGTAIGTNTVISSFRVFNENTNISSSFTYSIGDGGSSATINGYGIVIEPDGDIIINSASGVTEINTAVPVHATNGQITIDKTLWLVKINQGASGIPGQDGRIAEATASVDANIGTPSVDLTVEGGGSTTGQILNFAFHNLKGEKGDNGTDATITEATATIGTQIGTPTVEVTLGGSEHERTFSFAFDGLKGEKGDKGDEGGPITTQATPTVLGGVYLYDGIGENTNGPVDQATFTALYNYAHDIESKGKVIKTHGWYVFNTTIETWSLDTVTGGSTYSSVSANSPAIEIFYNGLILVEGLEYSVSNGLVTFTNALGTGSNQTLSVIYTYLTE